MDHGQVVRVRGEGSMKYTWKEQTAKKSPIDLLWTFPSNCRENTLQYLWTFGGGRKRDLCFIKLRKLRIRKEAESVYGWNPINNSDGGNVAQSYYTPGAGWRRWRSLFHRHLPEVGGTSPAAVFHFFIFFGRYNEQQNHIICIFRTTRNAVNPDTSMTWRDACCTSNMIVFFFFFRFQIIQQQMIYIWTPL